MDTCHECGKVLESEQFKTCERCRELNRKRCQKWRELNPERKREQVHSYKEKNRDKVREDERNRYWDNIEKERERSRRRYILHPETLKNWQKANPEKVTAYKKKWKTENQEKLITYKHARRARELGNGGSYTLSELNALFEQQEGFCYYCGDLLYASFDKQIHVEHKTPLSRGGTNYIENIALSCAKCNFAKHTKTEEEFLKEIK